MCYLKLNKTFKVKPQLVVQVPYTQACADDIVFLIAFLKKINLFVLFYKKKLDSLAIMSPTKLNHIELNHTEPNHIELNRAEPKHTVLNKLILN